MPTSEANVVSLLREAASRNPQREAISVGLPDARFERITFQQLWHRVDQVGCGLSKLGLSSEDRAVIMVPMSIDLYVVLLAVLKIGAAAVFVDPWIGRRQIAEFTAFAEPTAFVGINKSHLLRLMDRRLRQIPIAVTTERAFLGVPARFRLSDLLDTSGNDAIADVDAEQSALITFTTGSSGSPKGANRTHSYLLAQHAALQREFPYTDADVDLTMFPVFALNNLAKGITTVVPNIDFRKVAKADGQQLLRQIEQESVTTITASPPLIDRLQSAVSSRDSPKQLRRILVGGAPVSDAQLQSWQTAFPQVELVVVYGSTEAEPVAHIEASQRLATKSTVHPVTPGFCTGVPTALLETKLISIIDEPIQLGSAGWQEWEVPLGDIGELVVLGDHVGKEYFRNAEATTANKIRDDQGQIWHRMGDTGYFDSDGHFWLTGRVHSTITRGGILIHPQLIEQAVAGAGVRRVAAIGLKDQSLGERLVLVVETDDCSLLFAKELAQRLQTPGVEFDEIVLTSEPLPVDPRHNSKIDYGQVALMITESTIGSEMARWSSADVLVSASKGFNE